MDHFTTKAKALLQDRNHGVLLAGITLVTEMCELDDSICAEFRKVSALFDLLLTSRERDCLSNI